jgi:ribosomal protein S18 acetylase RimI-like enzyme
MDGLIIRPAALGEAGVLADVHVEGRRWAYRGLLPDALLDAPEVWERRESMWSRVLHQGAPRRETLLAERDGAVVGLVAAGPSRDDDASDGTAEIYALYLRWQALAGRGVGRALMVAAIAALRSHGFGEATLWVLTANLRARAF